MGELFGMRRRLQGVRPVANPNPRSTRGEHEDDGTQDTRISPQHEQGSLACAAGWDEKFSWRSNWFGMVNQNQPFFSTK